MACKAFAVVGLSVLLIIVAGCASPTPTPEPTAPPPPTPTSEPTPTPTPQPTATPTSTPRPTATSTPTSEPTATSTPTPRPTATPRPRPTATPTIAPAYDPNRTPHERLVSLCDSDLKELLAIRAELLAIISENQRYDELTSASHSRLLTPEEGAELDAWEKRLDDINDRSREISYSFYSVFLEVTGSEALAKNYSAYRGDGGRILEACNLLRHAVSPNP